MLISNLIPTPMCCIGTLSNMVKPNCSLLDFMNRFLYFNTLIVLILKGSDLKALVTKKAYDCLKMSGF